VKYTLEHIKKTYCILVVSNTTGSMWFSINNGKQFKEYVVYHFEDDIHYKRSFSFNTVHLETENTTLSNNYSVFLYDLENFIRHFGLRFMKF